MNKRTWNWIKTARSYLIFFFQFIYCVHRYNRYRRTSMQHQYWYSGPQTLSPHAGNISWQFRLDWWALSYMRCLGSSTRPVPSGNLMNISIFVQWIVTESMRFRIYVKMARINSTIILPGFSLVSRWPVSQSVFSTHSIPSLPCLHNLNELNRDQLSAIMQPAASMDLRFQKCLNLLIKFVSGSSVQIQIVSVQFIKFVNAFSLEDWMHQMPSQWCRCQFSVVGRGQFLGEAAKMECKNQIK